MKMRKTFLIVIFSATCLCVFPQTVVQPNYALKSHPTLEIRKIEIKPGNTVVSMRVENLISGGQFCADRNIYIIYPDGTKSRLLSSEGIPSCPASHKFRKVGEKLDFTLTFGTITAGTQWIDIIEDCSDNCFSFYGVVLESALNSKIDEAVSVSERGETQKSIDLYRNILSGIAGTSNGMEGALYADIIALLVKSGKTEEAKEWYAKMITSDSPRLELYIKNLNSRGIKF